MAKNQNYSELNIEDVRVPILYIKDNCDGEVRMLGTDHHDTLDCSDGGLLYYYNMQNGVGSQFQDEGYSFCDKNGKVYSDEELYGNCIFMTPLLSFIDRLGYKVVKKDNTI